MTKKQFKEINARLKKWRDDRQLSLESQRDGLVLNLLEELVEFGRAKNEFEKIDALCDMYVFLLNSYPLDSIFWHEDIKGDFSAILTMISGFTHIDFNKHIDNKLSVLQDKVELIAVKLEITLINLGYEPYLCLCETLKEIESRSGKYDSNAKKWIKDSNVECYVADYSNCKLESKKGE